MFVSFCYIFIWWAVCQKLFIQKHFGTVLSKCSVVKQDSLAWKIVGSQGINVVRDGRKSSGILLMVREKWCVLSKLHDCCLFLLKWNENTHSVHVITKWWQKGVGVREQELTKNYIKLVLAPEMGKGIMSNTVRETRGILFLKLSGNPVE